MLVVQTAARKPPPLAQTSTRGRLPAELGQDVAPWDFVRTNEPDLFGRLRLVEPEVRARVRRVMGGEHADSAFVRVAAREPYEQRDDADDEEDVHAAEPKRKRSEPRGHEREQNAEPRRGRHGGAAKKRAREVYADEEHEKHRREHVVMHDVGAVRAQRPEIEQGGDALGQVRADARRDARGHVVGQRDQGARDEDADERAEDHRPAPRRPQPSFAPDEERDGHDEREGERGRAVEQVLPRRHRGDDLVGRAAEIRALDEQVAHEKELAREQRRGETGDALLEALLVPEEAAEPETAAEPEKNDRDHGPQLDEQEQVAGKIQGDPEGIDDPSQDRLHVDHSNRISGDAQAPISDDVSASGCGRGSLARMPSRSRPPSCARVHARSWRSGPPCSRRAAAP